MRRSEHIGIVGNLALDHHFAGATLVFEGTSVTVTHRGESYTLSSGEHLFPGAKVTAEAIPEALLARAESTNYGGGGYNSLQALRAAVHTNIRYLDECALEPEVLAHFDAGGMHVRSLDLRPIPKNAIIGS